VGDNANLQEHLKEVFFILKRWKIRRCSGVKAKGVPSTFCRVLGKGMEVSEVPSGEL